MVARHGVGPVPMPAPEGVVAPGEVLDGRVRIGHVARQEDRARQRSRASGPSTRRPAGRTSRRRPPPRCQSAASRPERSWWSSWRDRRGRPGRGGRGAGAAGGPPPHASASVRRAATPAARRSPRVTERSGEMPPSVPRFSRADGRWRAVTRLHRPQRRFCLARPGNARRQVGGRRHEYPVTPCLAARRPRWHLRSAPVTNGEPGQWDRGRGFRQDAHVRICLPRVRAPLRDPGPVFVQDSDLPPLRQRGTREAVLRVRHRWRRGQGRLVLQPARGRWLRDRPRQVGSTCYALVGDASGSAFRPVGRGNAVRSPGALGPGAGAR